MNIRDVAKRAAVSTATVSRTIVNGAPTVNPYLARRVWKAIEELGFYPDTQARGLVSAMQPHLRANHFKRLPILFSPKLSRALNTLLAPDNDEMLMNLHVA